MIIFIHGFGSSGFSFKADKARDYFEPKEAVLAPSLSYVPILAIKTLEEIIEYGLKQGRVSLIGSSLGGYYAHYLSNKYNIKAVLVNPALNADIRLSQESGMATNYYDLSKFEWSSSHIEQLKALKIENPNEKNLMLMLQKGDEVINYKEALEMLPNAKIILEEGGDHIFLGFAEHLEEIEKFFLN